MIGSMSLSKHHSPGALLLAAAALCFAPSCTEQVDCDCDFGHYAYPMTFGNGTAEPLTLVWEHLGQEFSATLEADATVTVALFDVLGDSEHETCYGVGRTSMRVERCDGGSVVLLGPLGNGGFFRAKWLNGYGPFYGVRGNLYDADIVLLTDRLLSETDEEGKAAGL